MKMTQKKDDLKRKLNEKDANLKMKTIVYLSDLSKFWWCSDKCQHAFSLSCCELLLFPLTGKALFNYSGRISQWNQTSKDTCTEMIYYKTILQITYYLVFWYVSCFFFSWVQPQYELLSLFIVRPIVQYPILWVSPYPPFMFLCPPYVHIFAPFPHIICNISGFLRALGLQDTGTLWHRDKRIPGHLDTGIMGLLFSLA